MSISKKIITIRLEWVARFEPTDTADTKVPIKIDPVGLHDGMDPTQATFSILFVLVFEFDYITGWTNRSDNNSTYLSAIPRPEAVIVADDWSWP